MQLLLQHNQKQSMFTRQRFVLWAKFELTPAEMELIEKYKPQGAVLSPGDPKEATSKWRRALIFGGIIAFLVGLVSMFWFKDNVLFPWMARVIGPYVLTLVAWPIVTFFIYNYTRDAVLVGDVLTGRYFMSRDVMALLDKESMIREYAYGFGRFLEQMKTWGNIDAAQVIPIDLDQAPPMRALEASHGR